MTIVHSEHRVSPFSPEQIENWEAFKQEFWGDLSLRETVANAELIIRAVNAHGDLVAALREIAGQPLGAELGDDGPHVFAEGYDQCIRKARAVLAKTEAQS